MARREKQGNGRTTNDPAAASESRSGGTATAERTESGAGQSEAALAPALTWPGPSRGSIPATPWELMWRMSEEMDWLLESLGAPRTGIAPSGRLSPMGSNAPRTVVAELAAPYAAAWVPQIDAIQRPNELVIRAELSGMKPEDINVSVEDGMLTIWGERRQEHQDDRDGVIRTERSYGRFSRTLPLPKDADESRVTATFRNGILEVIVPVSKWERGRRIAVKS